MAITGNTISAIYRKLSALDQFRPVFPVGAKPLAVVIPTDTVAEVAGESHTPRKLSRFKPSFSAV